MPLLTSLAATPTRPANGMARQAVEDTHDDRDGSHHREVGRDATGGTARGRPEGEDEREDMRTRVRGDGLSPGIPPAQPDSHIGLYELSHPVPVWTGAKSFTFHFESGMAAMGAADLLDNHRGD